MLELSFQSPRNRVNTSNVEDTEGSCLIIRMQFQSPRNRVNTSNSGARKTGGSQRRPVSIP